MKKASRFVYFSLLILIMTKSGRSIQCYICNSTVTGSACEQGLKSLPTKVCKDGEICATYIYDVFRNTSKIGTGVSRGCEVNKNYCGIVGEVVNIFVAPHSVREQECMMCKSHLCNAAEKPLYVLTSTILFSLVCCIFLS
ncbi:hypothetical protein HHI36_015559 [Cryptolaemus montrouzieri]|uniref:Protein sleepless n=1 Tax=Cryptolaemus montrouzieri TaxID=559131 RepID=A0ABD2N752_9CUCU